MTDELAQTKAQLEQCRGDLARSTRKYEIALRELCDTQVSLAAAQRTIATLLAENGELRAGGGSRQSDG